MKLPENIEDKFVIMKLKIFSAAMYLFCSLFFSVGVEAKFKFPAPIPTTEFDQMDFSQVYPTFSWEPVPKTEFYQIQVIKDGKVFRELKNSEGFNRVTDWQPYLEEGKYFWQVRVVNKKNKPLSDWSEKKFFEVTSPVKYAVLGDSISHGGANFIPAGQLSCQWETYCDLPIKNIARSGDTTSMMIERFDRDVLKFQPKVLLIMGVINDIREGKSADEVISNFEILREKCFENDIVPVFATLTPMNEKIVKLKGIFLTEGDWKKELQKVNSWILQNDGIDISEKLFDENGELRAELTPDGLHPALRGKKLIGETIERYLMKKFVALE